MHCSLQDAGIAQHKHFSLSKRGHKEQATGKLVKMNHNRNHYVLMLFLLNAILDENSLSTNSSLVLIIFIFT